MVRWFERHGRLRARVDDRGVHSYARTEVAELARQRAARGTPSRKGDRDVLRDAVAGELAAQAFGLFRMGAALDEVVIRTKLSPERVRELYLEFQTPIELPSPVAIERARERLEAGVPPAASADAQQQRPRFANVPGLARKVPAR
jgi:hypothetical protein